ncbi:uncharacterized protein LOC121419009 [Lytechinus variegatus]|uniref:uncharacterized protein LOC121419009 n=1 Tax=Lytechinus variegatus TaxID=7654 RepID=UPI001BB22FA7|nr:uncharacterized protein LOC121419009 [Lytechinus variegatus]
MSLTKFKLPGKDCRCILYDDKVCKIKTLMPPLNEGIISDYVDDRSLQEEVEDIIRSVLCIPENVDPVMMRTQHLVVKPEKKEWKLPDKVVFKLPDKPLVALSYMYILHLQLLSKQEIHQESPVQITKEEHVQSNKRKTERSPSKSSEQNKRPQRRPIPKKTTLSSSLPRRSNRRLAPSRGSATSTNQSGRVLRRRALRFTSNKNSTSNNSNEQPRRGSNTFPPVDVGLDETGMGDGLDGQTGRKKNRERIEIERQKRERSPELESGFSNLVQRKALDRERFPSLNESWDKDHVECNGDKPPKHVLPSEDGGVARVGVPGHPGRERVEQHVLQEQLRLQEMASPEKVTTAEEQGQTDKGIVHHMFDAVVTPVKNFFFRD